MTPCDIEVITFVATEGAYFFATGDRRQVDIMKCRTLQPEISDHENYSSYLWVKGYQGYFLLKQLFVDHRPGEWRVIREVEPEPEDFEFFERYGDELEVELQA